MYVHTLKVTTLEMIAKGAPLVEVTDHICRRIEACFVGVSCSMLSVDRSGTLRSLSAPSLPKSYSQSLDNLPIGPLAGSCGTAAYFGRPVEVMDIASDPRWTPYPAAQRVLSDLGLRACWSSPLVDETGQVLATFALYFPESRGPTQLERNIVETCLHLCDLVFARQGRVADREHRANTDALTRLPNQGSFARALAPLNCDVASMWAILAIDLDNLKTVNDTFGHAVGDRLLQEVAQRLADFAIPDTAFRVGGDEFILLVKDLDRLKDIHRTARAVLGVLAKPIEFEHFTVIPQATMGVALVSGEEDAPEIVRHNADIALYHAKETRRGGFVCYRHGMRTRIVARLSSIESVHAALAEERIEAWYQPIVRLEDRRILGLEALCRMETLSGEIVTAGAFAEATSDPRIAPILTRRMLSTVYNDMCAWHAMGIEFGYVGVNVTAVDLRGGRLAKALDEIFEDKELIARLVIEVTETVYIGERDKVVVEAVRALKARGVQIALDDFGTGFASLTHLLDMPVDFIKIDQSFTSRLPNDEVSATIISGLVAIADKLGAEVTAEGVETRAQAAMLERLGCAVGQGFLFARAKNRSETARLLMRHSAHDPHGARMLAPVKGVKRKDHSTLVDERRQQAGW